MINKNDIQLVVRFCFYPIHTKESDAAVKLIEELVLPDESKSYSPAQMENYIRFTLAYKRNHEQSPAPVPG